MSKMEYGQVVANTKIAPDIYKMTIQAPQIVETAKAGQFVELYLDKAEHLLPRPISICQIDKTLGQLTIVYQVVGKGTEYFAALAPGSNIKMLGPIGNGFTIAGGASHLLVGGGIGTPPLLQLALDIRAAQPNAHITAVLGFRSEPILEEEFLNCCDRVHVATDNGAKGFKGNVVQLIEKFSITADMTYACGPKVMLRSLAAWSSKNSIPCQVSMEERMACGVGACVGCVVKIKKDTDWEYKKVCKDGPVFLAEEVAWDE